MGGISLGIAFSTLLLVLYIGGFMGEIGVFVAAMFLPFAVVIALALGLPIFSFFAKRGWLDWWHAALAGALTMAVLFVIVTLSQRSNAPLPLSDVIPLLAIGAFMGVVSWLIGAYSKRREKFVSSGFPVLIPLAILLPWGAFKLGEYTSTQSEKRRYIHGCIEAFQRSPNPTNQSQFFVKVRTGSGGSFSVPLASGSKYANPDLVGNCARIAKVRNSDRRGFRYRLDRPKVAPKYCPQSCR